MTFDKFINTLKEQGVDVSCETCEKLEAYGTTLVKWQSYMNLVSRHTIENMWQQHFLDSIQLVLYSPKQVRLHVDLGSGAGFPGLVMSILGVAEKTLLIESNKRKSAFLREIIRVTDANAEVVCERIESYGDKISDVGLITARALASLDKLFELATPLGDKTTTYLFLKGQNVKDELAQVHRGWEFKYKSYQGIADDRTIILRVNDVIKKSANAV